jgi:uncharacterized protein
MLALRPNCECCDRDLPPDSRDAMICSFECAFCRQCTEGILAGACPNCGGELVVRPVRPASKLLKYPASVERVFKPEGCRGTTRNLG